MITCSAKELKELHELEKWQENNQNHNTNDNDNENDKPATASAFVWQEKKESTL